MSTEDKRRYFWLKLDKNFFDRHDIKIIASMENGNEYVLMYLKLLCEATSHNGELRFSESVPYTLKMLSAVIDMDVDSLKVGVEIIRELGLMEIDENGTIIMTEMAKMLGSETHQTRRKHKDVDKVVKSTTSLPPSYQNHTTDTETDTDTEIDTETETETETDTETDSCCYNNNKETIWGRLTMAEIEKINTTYERAEELIEAVDDDVGLKNKKVVKPYQYVMGYAKNRGWPKRKT